MPYKKKTDLNKGNVIIYTMKDSLPAKTFQKVDVGVINYKYWHKYKNREGEKGTQL